MSAPEAERQTAPSSRLLARAAMISAVLSAAGSALGLVRDLLIAGLFGANRGTDAFLVAWTIPETLTPLLIDGAMTMVMVPAFGRAIAEADRRRRERLDDADSPVRELVEATLLRFVIVMSVIGLLAGLFAPQLVALLTPGLADPELAVRCMRIVAVTMPLLGIAGYLTAALRSYSRFAPPALIYLAYNVGIIATVLLTFRALGVTGAAIGISVGAALMVAVQAPAAIKVLPRIRWSAALRRGRIVTIAAIVPVGLYTLTRQSQTFVERFYASHLAEGTITHLNYAQKVSQIPITLAFVAAAVTFPIFARSVAGGRTSEARRRMEIDLLVVGSIAVFVTAFLFVEAGPVVELLYQRGQFSAADSASTAAIMQVYALGLVGQATVNLLIRPYFTLDRPSWSPLVAMFVGLVVTAVAAGLLLPTLGAVGIAAANAAGITVTAAILALRSRWTIPTSPGWGAYLRLLWTAGVGVLAVLLALPIRAALAGSGPVVTLLASGGVLVAVIGVGALIIHWKSVRPGRPAPDAGASS